MPKLDEAVGAPSHLGSNLQAGVEAISSNQTVLFTRYVRVVLPIDSYVFWVRADRVGPSAMLNTTTLNKSLTPKLPATPATQYGARLNEAGQVVVPATTLNAQGSLHYSTDTEQAEATTLGINRVVFTSQEPINDLNQIGANEIYIGVIDGIKFAFSTRGSFYRQSALWHYVGAAVYADMDSQIIDNPRLLNVRDVIVSNSLPLWLALNGYVAPYGFSNPGVTLYPSFLIPGNLPPPYGAVHIDPAGTRALTGGPRIGPDSSHTQLCADRVRITLFGMRNFNALDFLDCVLQRSLDYDEFGIINSSPVPRDEKRTQSELNAIAQKKTIEFEISYYQSRMNDIARQLILSAIPSFYPTDLDAAA